jgi:squalene-hopene cyclase-like protein
VRRTAAALALVLAATLLATTAASAPNPARQASLERTVRYLQEAQQRNGGFGAAGEPSQITSAWTALALAAAGINPQDQRRPGGVDAFSYLVSHHRQGIEESECAPVACTTTLERELMVVNSSGTDPHDFGGVDLLAALLARAGADGSFPHQAGGSAGVNDTIFAVFALAPVPEPAAQAAIRPAAEWIEAVQHSSGGWAWNPTSAEDEVDMTGAAIQALVAAGRGESIAVQKGLAYLRAAQNPDGGFPNLPGNPESNAASTAWATQAIWAVGENPEDWRSGSGLPTEEPLDYLESLQEPDGHIRWKRSQDMNGVWMTAYTTPAFSGHPWPIPAPPRSRPPARPSAPGQGEGSQSGAGVIAGGGGRGAPLFSRPKPQSRGKTPGAARVLRNEGVRVVDHSESRRGANERQPRRTQGVEASVPPRGSAAGGSGTAASGGKGGDGSEGTGPGADGDGSGGSPLPQGLAEAGRAAQASQGGRRVTGTLVGSLRSAAPGELAFGAPGLHGAGAGEDEESVAIAIGALALLVVIGGAGWERHRQEAVL